MDPTTRTAALEFLFGRLNYERTATIPYQPQFLKLDRMRALLRRLGDPHRHVPVVHVAGSKGKGSTSTMLSRVLTSAGYRTGLYTSPHLITPEERIRVDNRMCSESQFVHLLQQVQRVVEAMDAETVRARSTHAENGPLSDPDLIEGQPTYFEILTAMAFLFFRQQKVDVAVVEVGLGGRLDSTNVCHPLITVITSISLDHMRQLGNTLPEIAREKAGIIKTGIPVVSGVVDPASRDVIEEVAGQHAAPLTMVDRDFSYDYQMMQAKGDASGEPRSDNRVTEQFVFRPALFEQPEEPTIYRLGMWGRHQAANGAVAVATCRELRRLGWNIPEDAIAFGIETAQCAARIEQVRKVPPVILDAAHNGASLQALLDTIDARYPQQPLWILMAATRGKDIDSLLTLVLQRADRVVATQYVENPRSVAAGTLFQLMTQMAEKLPLGACRATVECCPDANLAWGRLLAEASDQTVLCVTGSFFLAAELSATVRAIEAGTRS